MRDIIIEMVRLRAVALASVVGCVAISACGIDAVGTATSDVTEGGVPPSTPPGTPPAPPEADGSVLTDANDDVAVDASPSCQCADTVPSGWTRYGFAASRSATCPTGYAPIDVVESPVAGAGACTCGCSVTAQPSCNVGAIPCWVDGTSQCGSPGANTPNSPSGGCDDYGNTVSVSNHLRLKPPAATGGTCAGSATKHLDQISATQERLCAPQTGACEATLCADAGVAECISQDGDVACPGAPWTTKHLVGPSADVACGAGCGCASVNATCNGTLTVYTDSACTQNALALIADDTCHATNQTGIGWRYYKYVGAIAGGAATCTPSGTSTGTASIVTPRTICCR